MRVLALVAFCGCSSPILDNGRYSVELVIVDSSCSQVPVLETSTNLWVCPAGSPFDDLLFAEQPEELECPAPVQSGTHLWDVQRSDSTYRIDDLDTLVAMDGIGDTELLEAGGTGPHYLPFETSSADWSLELYPGGSGTLVVELPTYDDRCEVIADVTY